MSEDRSSADESLKDVFGILADATKEDPQIIAKRQERVRELESNDSLSKFPSEMSCVTAMDELLQCFSVGGQLRHYYRYGELSLCQRQHEKLMFCLKNSTKAEEEKKLNIAKFFQKRFIEDCKKGSSEDIWSSR